MKTIFDLCKPRVSVFDENKRDDTLDLSNLKEGNIDAERFFDETFVTDGMELLFDTAFKRFEGKGATGLIKLNQAMGGGKTHNMLALGLLAANSDLRKKMFEGKYATVDQDIKLISFTGRESYLAYGLWGEIAEQMGKKTLFNPFYSPLMAPGQSAWINLLKGDTPILILLDELPPYLENAKTIPVGSGTLADVTTTALSNLFNAVGKAELANVCIVVSDLRATYEDGSQYLQRTFKNLENEIERHAINIEPVRSNSDDLYHILRTRLFEKTASKDQITEIATGYKEAIKEARQMGYTNYSPEEFVKGIYSSYPFHPSVRDLFARFKENPGFQQTRGFIRLTRMMVKELYSTGNDKNNKEPVAKKRYLINAYDMDLNDRDLLPLVKSIKEKLTNAISHDIASKGYAVAETIDAETNSTDMQQLSQLILVASLANVTNAILGLSDQEIIGYMAEPGRDITQFKKMLENYKGKAWYLYSDKNGRLHFRDTKNVNAELNDLINTYSYEMAKQRIKKLFKEKFKPTIADCYQEVMVFPSIEEIDLLRDKVTLLISEPDPERGGLQEDLEKFYQECRYKNRVLFLTGQRNSMTSLVEMAKKYEAIETILYRMKEEDKIPEKDSQFRLANDLYDKIELQLLQTTRETFMMLYFPKRDGLSKSDFRMNFENNNYDIEGQIRDLLEEKMKFTTKITPADLKDKFEDRLFTQPKMRWNDLKERAATTTSWQWHNPRALDDLKDDSLKRGKWIDEGGYIDKEPPPPTTSVSVNEVSRNEETGEVTLKIIPHNGDRIHYEIEQPATEASQKVANPNDFKTKELKLSFICVDSKEKNKTGEPAEWQNKIKLKYKTYDSDSLKKLKLQADNPNVVIKYTTDGSDPVQNGGIFEDDVEIPYGSKYIQAVAVHKTYGVLSDPLIVEVKPEEQFQVDREKPLTLRFDEKTTNTKESFELLEKLSKYDLRLADVMMNINETSGNGKSGYGEILLGNLNISSSKVLEQELQGLIDRFFKGLNYQINIRIDVLTFAKGSEFEKWVADRKETIQQYRDQITQ